MFCQKYVLPLLNVEKYARLCICLFSIVWPIKCNFCCWITLLLFCTWRGHYDGYWKFSYLLPNIATAFNAIWQLELGNSNCIALIHKNLQTCSWLASFVAYMKNASIFFLPNFPDRLVESGSILALTRRLLTTITATPSPTTTLGKVTFAIISWDDARNSFA